MTWPISTKVYLGEAGVFQGTCVFYRGFSRGGRFLEDFSRPRVLGTLFGQVPAPLHASVSSSAKGECQSFSEEGLMALKHMDVSGPQAILSDRRGKVTKMHTTSLSL